MIETKKAVLLSVAEAAQRLSMDESQLRLFLRQGRIAGEKFGRDWMIPESALAQFKPQKRGRPRKAGK